MYKFRNLLEYYSEIFHSLIFLIHLYLITNGSEKNIERVTITFD